MAGTVITVSPRVSVDALERLARRRVERDGVAELAAKTDDDRQMRQLQRLAHRFVGDEHLAYAIRHHRDGATYLTLLPAGQDRPIWWSGDPKLG